MSITERLVKKKDIGRESNWADEWERRAGRRQRCIEAKGEKATRPKKEGGIEWVKEETIVAW